MSCHSLTSPSNIARFLFLLTSCFSWGCALPAQVSDTLFYEDYTPQWVSHYDATRTQVRIELFNRAGGHMLDASFLKDKYQYIPTESFKVLGDSAQVIIEYLHEEGIYRLFKWDEPVIRGETLLPMKAKMGVQREFYPDGTLRKEYDMEKEVGKQGFKFNISRPSGNPYPVSAYPNAKPVGEYGNLTSMREYHPNGNLHHETRPGRGKHGTQPEHLFYDLEGKLDTNTYYYPAASRMGGNLRHGKFYTYDYQGILIRINQYDSTRQYGPQLSYYPNGQLEAEEHYHYGVRTGIHRKWAEDGQLLQETHYKEGRQHGPDTRWHPNGKVATQALYKEGGIVGKQKIWHANGQLQDIRHHPPNSQEEPTKAWFKNGQYNKLGSPWLGIELHFDSLGNETQEIHRLPEVLNHNLPLPTRDLRHEGNRENGLREGSWQAWYPNGELCYSAQFHLGLLEGPFHYHYPSGQPALTTHFSKGLAEGKVEAWAPNETLIATGQVKRGMKTGIWHLYNDQGVLQDINDYRKEVLECRLFHRFNDTLILAQSEELSTGTKVVYRDLHPPYPIYQQYYRPNGHQEWDREDFHKTDSTQRGGGPLRSRTTHYNDRPNDYLYELFWPNGRPRSRLYIENKKANGPGVLWYESGQLKGTGPYENGERTGICKWWDGYSLPDKQFIEGVEQIRPYPGDERVSCACNRQFGNGIYPGYYLPSAERYFSLEAVNQRVMGMELNRKSFDKMFFNSYPNSGLGSGSAIIYGDVYFELPSQPGMRLCLTACRRGENHAEIGFYYSNRSIQLEKLNLALEFPETFLEHWDTLDHTSFVPWEKRLRPVRALQRSRATEFNFDQYPHLMSYSPRNNFTPARIKGTRVVIYPREGTITARQNPENKPEWGLQWYGSGGTSTFRIYHRKRHFFKVDVQVGNLNDQRFWGTAEISPQALPGNWSEQKLKRKLRKAGLVLEGWMGPDDHIDSWRFGFNCEARHVD